MACNPAGAATAMTATIACAFDADGLETFAAGSNAAAVDILILPELFDGGYARLESGGSSAERTARILDRLSGISRQHRLHLIGGSLALPGPDGKVRNTSVVFSNGIEIARYTKTHLFRPLRDDIHFAPGHPGEILGLQCGDETIYVGVIICYDLRFPEIVRPWFREGLTLLAVPARWPRVRDDVWKTLLRARAIENQCFVVGVDSRDDEGGGSYVFGPAGEIVFDLGPDPRPEDRPWYSFAIDTAAIDTVKSRFDTRRDAVLL
ncbi:MAG TPA: nitrilase-related carbon-nitrogen hydrolase [candidate division Zixibacteria bacterium]|jgi:predicted amidohydrolase